MRLKLTLVRKAGAAHGLGAQQAPTTYREIADQGPKAKLNLS